MELNNESLNNAIVCFLVKSDPLFATVKQKSFHALLCLLNEEASPLITNTCQSGLSTHLNRVFLQLQETIKLQFIAKKDHISFKANTWTTPNVTAFMAVSAHYLDSNFEMKDLNLAVPHIQGVSFHFLFIYHFYGSRIHPKTFFSPGNHTGKMFAEEFNEVLANYGCIKKIHTITADNALTNN